MSIRKFLNENAPVTIGITVVVVALALWIAFGTGSRSSGQGAGTYYTVDNGATYFKHKTDELPPFTYEGKEAVRAYVFRCPDGEPFVGYLEKYSPEAKTVLTKLNTAKTKEELPDMGQAQMLATRGRLVKKPEDKDWISTSDGGRSGRVTRVVCPDGNPALPE